MKSQTLFDAAAGIGDLLLATPGCHGTLPELLDEMDRLSIAKALAWHRPCLAIDPLLSNRRFDKLAGKEKRIVRAWAAVPDTAGKVPKAEKFVDQLIRSGARAAKLFPVTMNWSLEEWCSGPLLSALEERRVPTILIFNETTLPALESMLDAHPDLPVIFSELNYRQNRMLFALLERHPNLHIDTAPPYSVHLGLETLSAKGLSSRVLFGTAWPKCDSGPAISQLMYAQIPLKERDAIGQGNLERLLKGVRA